MAERFKNRWTLPGPEKQFQLRARTRRLFVADSNYCKRPPFCSKCRAQMNGGSHRRDIVSRRGFRESDRQVKFEKYFIVLVTLDRPAISEQRSESPGRLVDVEGDPHSSGEVVTQIPDQSGMNGEVYPARPVLNRGNEFEVECHLRSVTLDRDAHRKANREVIAKICRYAVSTGNNREDDSDVSSNTILRPRLLRSCDRE